MSMVKTLAKAAVGIAVAKAATSMMGGGRRRGSASAGGIEDLLGSVLGGSAGGRSMGGRGGGGIEDLLGTMLGGAAGGAAGGRGAAGAGGIGDLLGAVLGGGAGGPGTGRPYGGAASRNGGDSVGGALGQILGGQGARGRGSVGGALEELSRMSTGSLQPQGMRDAGQSFDRPGQGSFGDLLNQSLNHYGEPDRAPTAAEESQATVLLRALIQAAKADGKIDASEKSQLTEQLGDLDQSEVNFVNSELRKPIDVAGLARDVPKGMEGQVYMISVMAIDLDTKEEAQYLGQLAQALGINPQQANAIHDRLGEPKIFR
ncbi:MAG: DUF533 domain-containing protein [Pseudomonadota bacterium]